LKSILTARGGGGRHLEERYETTVKVKDEKDSGKRNAFLLFILINQIFFINLNLSPRLFFFSHVLHLNPK